MGVCINNRLGQRKVFVKAMLDNAQEIAQLIKKEQAEKIGVSFEIRRLSDFDLLIDIGNCETLSFKFKSVKAIKEEKEKGWSYEWAVLTDDGKRPLNEGYAISDFPQNEIYYSASFCKTQFSKILVEHKWVADIIKVVASRCVFAEVNDEGDYYHSGVLADAQEAIAENGALIDSLTGKLAGNGFEVLKGGSTNIKSKKKYK